MSRLITLTELITMATVSKKFCQELLTNPSQVLAEGYQEEKFELTPRDKAFLLRHSANTLSELAEYILNQTKPPKPTIIVTPNYPIYVNYLAEKLLEFHIEPSNLPLNSKLEADLILLCLVGSVTFQNCTELIKLHPKKLAILTDFEKHRIPNYLLNKVSLISLKEDINKISEILHKTYRQKNLCSPKATKQILRQYTHTDDKTIKLTARENEILMLLDLPNQNIARELTISTSTVRRHIQNINEKLGFDVRNQLFNLSRTKV